MSEVKKQNAENQRPPMANNVRFDASTFNADSNTCDIVAATETPVLMRDWGGEVFYEVLSCNPDHIRSDRFASGAAPLVDNHNKYGSVTKLQLGVIRSFKVEKKQVVCTVQFSKRKKLEGFVEDVRDGIVQNASVGYKVYKYIDITKEGDEIRTLKAVDWEPIELSMTIVPADFKSKVRLASFEGVTEIVVDEINLNRSNNNMSKKAENGATPEAGANGAEITNRTDNPGGAPPAGGANANEANRTTEEEINTRMQDATAAETARIKGIMDFARTAKLDDEFVLRHIDAKTTLDKVRQDGIEEWSRAQGNVITGANGNAVTGGRDREHEGFVRGLEEVLDIRAFGISKAGKPETDLGKTLANGRSVSLLFLAERSLQKSGVQTAGLSDHEIYKRAMSSTDFPFALANVLNKSLRRFTTAAKPAWRSFATQIPVSDFKEISSVRVDGSFLPNELTEGGEYKMANFKETGDTFGLKTYGIMTAFTRKMMINDDLSAFNRFAQAFANGMLRNQAKIVTNLFTQNAGVGRTLADGNALFSAAHNNYDGAGAVMSIASFTAARTAMRRQVGLAGEPIEVQPAYLWIPPELETLAYQLVNATVIPNQQSNANPFKGMFEILVDAYLADTKAWHLIADPGQMESVKYATLNGEEGIYTEQEYNFKNDNLEIKARNDFNATIDESAGVYKNKGA